MRMITFYRYHLLCDGITGARFCHYGLPNIPDAALNEALFRIAGKLMDNVRKHAQATQVVLQLVVEENRACLVVEDNGCGFDPQTPSAGKGLKFVRETVDAHNGYLDVISQSGKGTEIVVEFKTIRN